MQYIYRSKHLVVIDGGVYVYKNSICKFDQPFVSFHPKHIFIGKSKVCEMTEFSGANGGSDFDGNTILLECRDNEYLYISGFEISKLKTEDKFIYYKSLLRVNMCAYAIMVGEKYTYFIAHHYNFIETDKIEEGTLLNATIDNLDAFVHRLAKCSKDSFKKLECNQIQTCWPNDDKQDENDDLDNTKCCFS